jgi:hypothetical protein
MMAVIEYLQIFTNGFSRKLTNQPPLRRINQERFACPISGIHPVLTKMIALALGFEIPKLVSGYNMLVPTETEFPKLSVQVPDGTV